MAVRFAASLGVYMCVYVADMHCTVYVVVRLV